jgi:hypothetical protein
VLREELAKRRNVTYLAIGDFGTRGLRGGDGLDAGVESSYIAFWRRYGETRKSGCRRASGSRKELADFSLFWPYRTIPSWPDRRRP